MLILQKKNFDCWKKAVKENSCDAVGAHLLLNGLANAQFCDIAACWLWALLIRLNVLSVMCIEA